MNITKLLLFFICLLAGPCLIAQNGWATCGSTAGLLNGNTADATLNDTLAAAVFFSSPTPTSAIPQTEFLIILQDSLASDSLGWAIIETSIDGAVSPAALGLSVGDTFSVVSFSYDIQQIKLAVQGILNNSVPFLGSCCGLIDSQSPIPGICDSLNAAGITDSSDVNDINDLLTFLAAFGGGGSTSQRGLNAVLVGINDQLGTLSATGCTNGVSEICYATDSLAINQDRYSVVTINTSTLYIEENKGLQLAVAPNPFDQKVQAFVKSQQNGTHIFNVFDTRGKTVLRRSKYIHQEQSLQLDLGGLAAGVYYLQVTDQYHTATQKIIKR